MTILFVFAHQTSVHNRSMRRYFTEIVTKVFNMGNRDKWENPIVTKMTQSIRLAIDGTDKNMEILSHLLSNSLSHSEILRQV